MNLLNKTQMEVMLLHDPGAPVDRQRVIEVLSDCQEAIIMLHRLVHLKEIKTRLEADAYSSMETERLDRTLYEDLKEKTWANAKETLNLKEDTK